MAGLAIVLVGVLGFFVLPPIVKYIAVSKMSEMLHRPVAIKTSASTRMPCRWYWKVWRSRRRKSDTFVGLDSFHVNLQAASLFRWGLVINEIKVVNPTFRAVRGRGKSLQFFRSD